MERVVSVLIDGTQLGTDRQHSWRSTSVTLMEYHEEVGWKSSDSWSAMREWLEVVALMECHEADRGTCSTCSVMVDVGES